MANRVSIPINAYEYEGRYWASLDHPDAPLLTYSYRTEAKARAKLRDAIVETVLGAEATDRNRQQTALFCGDGTVLVVQFRYGSWGYSMLHGNGEYACSSSGNSSHDETVKAATNHASQSFGGVVGRSRF